jgi:hypothetical protein|eukprot:COSAG02_NODE_1923_length_10327_cov_6.211501_14_plen_119_part_00
MSDFTHAPLTKAMDIAVLVAHAFWRHSGPASYPNYTCATPRQRAGYASLPADSRCVWVCSDKRASLAWRLLTGNFVMVQTSEVFFGLLLIYQVRAASLPPRANACFSPTPNRPAVRTA